MRTKHEVIEDVLSEYLLASKQSKKTILDRLEKVTRMQRKSIIRRLRRCWLHRLAEHRAQSHNLRHFHT